MEVPAPATPWWRDGRVWLLLLVTLATLQVGWNVKSRCHDTPWESQPGFQWRNYCYSDVQALYGTRGADDGQWPYIGASNEYPPLTGLYMHAMGRIGAALEPDGDVPERRLAYIQASSIGFTLLALATTVVLGELVGRDRRVLYWAAAPALALYAVYNWDLLAVAPALGALLAFRRGNMGLAGALLGLGASAKLYPAFLAPALGLWILRADGGLKRRGWQFGLGFFVVYAALHAPFLLVGPDEPGNGLVDGYRFQAERAPNFETPWYGIAHLGREWGHAWMDEADEKWVYGPGSLLPLLAALGFSGWAAWTRRLDPVAAACIPVFAFLAFNKVFSVQYTLWAIPLLVALPGPRTLKALVVVADLAVFVTLAQYFWSWELLPDGHTFTPAAFAAIGRAAAYATVAYVLARPAWRRAPDPQPASPRPDAAAPVPHAAEGPA